MEKLILEYRTAEPEIVTGRLLKEMMEILSETGSRIISVKVQSGDSVSIPNFMTNDVKKIAGT